MWRLLLLPALAIAGCGAGKETGNVADTPAQFELTSSDFGDGEPIPQVHSCDGRDQSPALGRAARGHEELRSDRGRS